MKRKRQRNYKMTTSTELDYMKVIKITVGVLLVLGLVYFLTALASGEIKFGKKGNTKEETTIQYQEIIAGETFNRKASEYYVLYANFSDKYMSYYLNQIANYNAKDNSLPFYTVDMEKKINSEYIETLNMNHPTLVKISGGNIVDKIQGHDNIVNFFTN